MEKSHSAQVLKEDLERECENRGTLGRFSLHLRHFNTLTYLVPEFEFPYRFLLFPITVSYRFLSRLSYPEISACQAKAKTFRKCLADRDFEPAFVHCSQEFRC